MSRVKPHGRRSARVIAIALLASLITPAGALRAAAPEIPEAVKQNIRTRVDLRYSPGIVVGVVDAEGTSYFGYGTTALAGGRTPDEHTIFEIGSISKVFTGILLARIVERGKLRLDDPVSRYLPDDVNVPARGDRPIRLVDLATHRSGLPRMPSNFDPEDPSNPFADYTPALMYEFLNAHDLRRNVGESYEYSNFGMGLLGHVLELRTRKSYEKLVSKIIAKPHGMTSTTVKLTDTMLERTARPHMSTAEVELWDLPTLAGAGAIRSTASDMLKFLAANMGLVETPLASSMTTSHEPRHDAGSPVMKVGLGWHIRLGEPDIVWHNGGTGGHRSFVGFRADGSLGTVVLANSTDSIDDIGMHLLDPSSALAVKKRSKIPLFKKD